MKVENNEPLKVEKKEKSYESYVSIKHPVEINGVLLSSIKLDFSKLTGDTVLKVDEELRDEGFPTGFDNIWNQQAILKIAARAAGMLTEDLRKLHAGDFMEVTFRTRNFFIGW
ncbi:hypothetical protein [Solibacillus sp.]|uniref:hypothetical protein n=1 Tax=Solibacillus sp. TaxID=1909654 RepID=UPI003315A25C